MKEIDTDIAIIGGGAAGMIAAVIAAENGVRVSVFEKAANTGGSGNMAGGPFAVESELQRRKLVVYTVEDAFNYLMDYTHWRVDARLVKAFLEKSGSTVDWLAGMGVEFYEPDTYIPGGPFLHHRINGRGAAMIKILTDEAEKLGVDIYLETPVKNIIKKDNRIIGIISEDEAGNEYHINAGAVIIGTGGFGDNPEWINKYTGYEWGSNLFSARVSGLIGDGIRMAWEVGAAKTEMHMETLSEMPPPFGGPFSEISGAFRQPNLMVNLDGERFINEDTGNSPFKGNAISRQKNSCGFNIFDEVARKYYEDIGWDSLLVGVPLTKNTKLVDKIKEAQGKGYKYVFIVESLEELCAKTGINLAGLLKTVDEYNKACESGHDGLFFKKAQYLKPIKQPKFYAGKFYVGGFGSLGGIKINYKTEVLSEDNEVIPGLYATGNDANAIYGDTYPIFLPGNSLGFAINTGRIAAENALEYIKKRNS